MPANGTLDPRASKLLAMKGRTFTADAIDDADHAKTPPAPASKPPAKPAAPEPDASANPCPDCGEPRNPANNRCYRCRPGGVAGVARPKGKPQPAGTEDAELAAICAVMAALDPLPVPSAKRAMRYVLERLRLED